MAPAEESAALQVGKEPWLAVILSKFLPGVGQIYAGQPFWGGAILCSYVGLLILSLILLLHPQGSVGLALISFLGGMVIGIGSLFDAYRCAKQANSSEFETLRKSSKDPWLAVFLTTILIGTGHFYIGRQWAGAIWLFFSMIGLVIPLNWILLPFAAFQVYSVTPVKRPLIKRSLAISCILLLAAQPLISLALALTIRTSIAEARWIPAGSMAPTLEINDRLIINKLIYRFEAPRRGDIIVFTPPEAIQSQYKEAFIKRIIGMPGEEVAVKDSKVYVNERALTESYTEEAPAYEWGPQIVPPNSYFVLGDNRNKSYDSHYWGFVPRKNIIGKAVTRFWPPNRMGHL